MKIAGAISAEDTKFGPLLYKGDLYKNIEKLGKLGYEGIEISLNDPKVINKEELKKTLKKYDLRLTALGTGQAVSSDGITFVDPNEKIREAAINRIKEHIKLASEFNSAVIIGLIKGNLPENSQKHIARKRVIEACLECSEFAKNYGVNIFLEAINRYEINWLNSISDVIDILKEINKKNVLLHIDTFHMNIEDSSFECSILKAKNLIGYVHFADSNRWVPGYGHINFQEIVSALEKIKYQGFITLEAFPLPDPDKAAKKGLENTRKLLSKYYYNLKS